ncbi:MAG: hypothetical protein ACE5KJ_02115 [Candidatus Zixiibacteriota bacterium]
MKLDKEDYETQVRRLLIFLDPKKSKLRPFLALFAIKNYILLKNKDLINNNPSVKWYLNQLTKAGISENYWGVRRQLKRMAKIGIFTVRKVFRPVDNSTQFHHRLTRIQLSEFYLNENLYLSLYHALTTIFKVDRLLSMVKRNDLKDIFHDPALKTKGKKNKKQTSKRTDRDCPV